MKKQALYKVILIICLLAVALGVSGCVDKGALPEGYVEVESLKINDPTVYLSPSGETSKFQLEVEILPANANQSLTYYIPSQYLKYVTVDENGLISAKMQPEEEIRIPLTVTSASNKKASLVVGLIIEYTAVRKISFVENDVELEYNGTPFQLAIKYEPYHAQDGRNITYTSLNPEIATVNATGLVTPIKVGKFTISAVGKTVSGMEVTANFNAKVRYAQSKFSLEVSDIAPRYRRTISDDSKISFNLHNLELNSDPNPRIQWYVGGERVNGMDGKMQYDHQPSVSTAMRYYVTVKVLCIGESEQSFSSKEIQIYYDFSGFDFVSENESKAYSNYLYNDTKTFEITSTGYGIDHFNWYLKRIGQETQALFVGRTEGTSPNLTKKLNIDGDFSLTAIGCDSLDERIEGQEQTFTFNVTRYVEEDTLILTPNVLNGGIPPESYNWYLFKCDNAGTIIDDGIPLSESVSNVVINGNTLYYKLNKNIGEKIVIRAKGMLEGRVAKVDGADYYYQTEPIKIYPKTGYTATDHPDDIVNNSEIMQLQYMARTDTTITDLIIDGVYDIGNYVPLVYWRAVGGVGSYVVEVTSDKGQVMLLDSTEYGGFDDYYCKLPLSFITLKDKFKIRVKQKGGQYTPYYHYGYSPGSESDFKYYFDKIQETQYKFLAAFDDVVVNGYIRSIKELGGILDYILLYEPSISENSLVYVTYGVSIIVGNQVESYDRKYSFKIYMEPEYKNYAVYYPISANTEGMDSLDINLYLSLLAAQNAYCETSELRVNMDFDSDDGGYFVDLYKNLNPKVLLETEGEAEINTDVTDHYSNNPYGQTNGEFAINYKNTKAAYTSDQLYNIAESGFQPVPQTTIASNIFNAAKQVINEIIGKDMTDREKVLAFYDWLILNVEYDYEVLTKITDTDNGYAYEAFHLDGVFVSNKAVCDGIAKAMSLLCQIEGIPCYKISGYIYANGGSGHAWNKVYIDGKWYVVDATWGGTTLPNSINYKYFMMTDSEFALYYLNPIIYGEFEKATTSYNYYANNFINGHDTFIESMEEFATLINSFNSATTIKIRLSDSFLAQYNNNLNAIINNLANQINSDLSEIASPDKSILKITINPKN
ncbi:MAG TPA: transglutaminase domain-containing protein [Clostridia bacterium]|nr:transglutaminase domain-containing protein [Clostridia bacterium]